MEILTLKIAKTLKGQKISTHYTGYAGQDGDDCFIVGEIISQYEFGKRSNYDGSKFKNYTEYWESYMTKSRLDEIKNTFELLDIDGKEHYIRCHSSSWYFEEPTFTCSDADRPVSFKIIM